MSRHLVIALLALALAGLIVTSLTIAAPNAAKNSLATQLSGAAQVPPIETLAKGQAVLRLNSEGTELSYTLRVTDIDNPTMAHIHLGTAKQNGPVLVWLYPPAPPAKLIPGKFSGLLAQGKITTANLVGPLKGKPLKDLIADIRADKAYVNIHTQQHPDGEIRGQIKVK